MALMEKLRGTLKREHQAPITFCVTDAVPSSTWTDELLDQVVADKSTHHVTLPPEIERDIERTLASDPDVQRSRRAAGV